VKGSRKIGLVVTVSRRALKVDPPRTWDSLGNPD
jgi:hypothetical protein